MATITDSDGWVPVTRPETTDIALGGNETNFPGKFFRELASRDRWLRNELESRTGTDATAIASFNRSRDVSQASIAQGRLTLATGNPTPSSDITAATTLYYTPYNGDLVSLWNSAGSRWDVHQFTERSLSLSGLAANANYDIFLWNNGGTLTLQAVGWSNSGAGTSTRASAISRRNGVWVKTSDDRRYLGTIRTTGVAGRCEASSQFLGISNVQNREERILQLNRTTDYTYGLNGVWRNSGGDSLIRFNLISALPQVVNCISVQTAYVQSGLNEASTSVALNSSAPYLTRVLAADGMSLAGDGHGVFGFASLEIGAGFNFLQQVERAENAAVQFVGIIGASGNSSGLQGRLLY